MPGRDEAERVHALTAEEWREWLQANHERSPGAWLVFWRSGTGRPRLSYEDAVFEALCFGWIDGQVRSRQSRIAKAAENAARGERGL